MAGWHRHLHRYRILFLLMAVHLIGLPLVYSSCVSTSEQKRHVEADSDTGCPVKCSCSRQDVGTTVDCSARHLTAVPDRLPDDTVALSLKDNNIKSLSDHDLANCTRLQVLDLARNGMNQLAPNAFLSTTNLRELFLNDNNISVFSLPANIFDKLHNLKLLYLHNNVWRRAKTYTDYLVANLSKLEHLSIDGKFTSCFSRLTNLFDLSIYGGIRKVSNNTFAVFSNTPITVLRIHTEILYDLERMSFAHFPLLQTLDLSYSGRLYINSLWRAWWGLQFTNITKLVLTRTTPDSIGASRINSHFFTNLDRTKITTLLLDKNNIVDIEPMLSSFLPYLEYLDLSYNRLSDVSSFTRDIWKLRHLRYLDISHQTKRYMDQKEKRSAEQSMSLMPFNKVTADPDGESVENSADFFQRCKTPPLKTCANIRKHHASKFPLPNYGTWCIPLPRKLRIVNLTESLNVNYKNMPSMILFGGSHLKLFKFQLNGLEELRGPFIITRPIIDAVIDLSDNKFSCIAPGAFNITFMLGSTFKELILSGNKLAAQMKADVSGITFKDFVHLDKLNLANNGIKRLSTGVFSHLPNTKSLNLSQNSLRQIDFEFSHMKVLQILDLSYNLLTSLQKRTLQKFAALMQTSNLTISLLGNPFQCSCETYNFLKWMHVHQNQLVNFAHYMCLYEGNIVRFSNLTKLVLVDLKFQCSKQIAVIAAACLLGLLLILIAISVCCYRYRWELRYFCLKVAKRSRRYQLLEDDETFTYDAFVVYSSEDSKWVHQELVPHLENDNDHQPLRLCVHTRDFLPGENIIGNIWSKMDVSRKVILVISRNFTKSNYCTYEIDLARMLGVEKARNVLVPVMLEDVRMEDMSDSLQWIVRKLTYIEWPKWKPDREEFWRRLRETVLEYDNLIHVSRISGGEE